MRNKKKNKNKKLRNVHVDVYIEHGYFKINDELE